MNSNMFELTKTIKAAVSGGSSGITDAILRQDIESLIAVLKMP